MLSFRAINDLNTAPVSIAALLLLADSRKIGFGRVGPRRNGVRAVAYAATLHAPTIRDAFQEEGQLTICLR
jgi:hypothetical protein